MPSFDIVSEVNLAEAENAIQNITREIATRYDFKGSKSRVEIKDGVITINADDQLKLKQMRELLQGHMQKRGIAPGSRLSERGDSGRPVLAPDGQGEAGR